MVGGWLMQGAPGVLSESAGQSEDRGIRGLSASSLSSVEGHGWLIEPKAPYTPYTFSTSYSEGSSGLYLKAMVLNGPSGESKDGAVLVELYLSNDASWKFHWFDAEGWAKEVTTIHTKQVTYVAGSLVAKPTSAVSCPPGFGYRKTISDNAESIEVKEGGWKCFRLVFPVEIPSGDSRFSLVISGIKLGKKEVPNLRLNYDRIPK